MLGLLNHGSATRAASSSRRSYLKPPSKSRKILPSWVKPDEVSVCPCTAGLSESAFTLLIGSGELPTGCLKKKASRSQRLPSAPLLSPVGYGRDRQEVSELNRVTAFQSAWQKKNLFL